MKQIKIEYIVFSIQNIFKTKSRKTELVQCLFHLLLHVHYSAKNHFSKIRSECYVFIFFRYYDFTLIDSVFFLNLCMRIHMYPLKFICVVAFDDFKISQLIFILFFRKVKFKISSIHEKLC